jgi:hypothetical protein
MAIEAQLDVGLKTRAAAAPGCLVRNANRDRRKGSTARRAGPIVASTDASRVREPVTTMTRHSIGKPLRTPLKAALFWYTSQVVTTPSTGPSSTPSAAMKALSARNERLTLRDWNRVLQHPDGASALAHATLPTSLAITARKQSDSPREQSAEQ